MQYSWFLLLTLCFLVLAIIYYQNRKLIRYQKIEKKFQQLEIELEKKIHERTIELADANQALKASESELLAIFASMSEVVLVKDIDGRYLKVAPTNLTKLLKPPEGLIGKTEYDLLPQAQADTFVGYIRQAIVAQAPINVEYSLDFGGQEVWFHANITPVSERSVVWVAQDITDRKQSEIELLQASQQIKLLNEQLKVENLRLGAELGVTRRL